MLHELKTIDKYYRRVFEGDKTFEVRRNDRDFQAGDTLRLIEIDSNGKETGRSKFFEVTYILEGGQFGILEGFCVMSIRASS